MKILTLTPIYLNTTVLYGTRDVFLGVLQQIYYAYV